jgi:hypothetical protein
MDKSRTILAVSERSYNHQTLYFRAAFEKSWHLRPDKTTNITPFTVV